MHFLELKITPPVVWLIHAALMCLTGLLSATTPLPEILRFPLAGVVALGGGGLIYVGFSSFRRALTTGSPTSPEDSTSLVSTGVYAITRNPIYLGMLLVLIAGALCLTSLWALLAPLSFALYITRFQIIPEERALETLFGLAFADYKRRVRRWL